MIITVERFYSDGDATLSTIFIDGEFQCFGLEDEFRQEKISGETRIPEGVYPITVRTFGGFHNRYAEKFKYFHAGMLEISNVPNFTDILIHIGNTDSDTAGCLLVGQGAKKGSKVAIQSSTAAYVDFYEKVIPHALRGDLTIRFIDRDRG